MPEPAPHPPLPGETPSSSETLRSVDLTMIGERRFKATNRRGGVLPIGAGDDPDFTPVELLLAALAGRGAIDLDHIAGKRAPDHNALNCRPHD